MTEPDSSGQVPTGSQEDGVLDRLDTIIQQNRAIEERLRTSGDAKRLHVKIADADMPFFSLVMLLVKIALASIPAMIIVWAIMFGLAIVAIIIVGTMNLSVGAVNALNDRSAGPSLLTDITTPTYSFTASPAATKSPVPSPSPPAGPIEMFEITSRTADGAYIVEGQVVNRGSTVIVDAYAVVMFYSENGQQTGRAKLNNLPLQPGKVSSFKVSSPIADASDFSVNFVGSLGRPLPFYDTAP